MKGLRRLPTYVALVAVSLLFLFPFYWVAISSLQSKAGLDLSPPPFYPAQPVTKTVIDQTPYQVKLLKGDRWLRMFKSVDLNNPNSGAGAYYFKLSGEVTTRDMQWFPDSQMAALPNATVTGAIRSEDLPVWKIQGQKMVVFGSQKRPNGASFDEIVLAAPMTGNLGQEGLVAFKNTDHEPVLEFHAQFSNYSQALKGPESTIGGQSYGFLTFLRNSFLLAMIAVVGQIISSALAAFAFARIQFKGRELLFVLLLATLMIPGQVTLIPLFFIYRQLHWVNTFFPLVVPNLTAGAFNVFLIRQFMLGIPRELDESAAIDGANARIVFWKVVFPNCVPVLVVIGLFTFVGSWQDVLGPLIYLDNPAYRTVPLGLEYFRSPYVDNRPLLLAGAVLSILPVLVVFLFAQRHILSGIATTGLKD